MTGLFWHREGCRDLQQAVELRCRGTQISPSQEVCSFFNYGLFSFLSLLLVQVAGVYCAVLFQADKDICSCQYLAALSLCHFSFAVLTLLLVVPS